MHNFCVVCFLTVSFCLVFGVFATAEISKEDAAKAVVEEAKQSVKTVREKAQSQLDSAKDFLQRVDSSKSAAAQASSNAEGVATENKEAEEIAQTIKRLSGEVASSYSDVKAKLTTAVSTLTQLVEEAQGLDDGSAIEITAKKGTEDDFTEASQKATDLKGQADALDNQINTAVKPISGVDVTANEMEKKVKEAQLKDYHVSAFVAVAKIARMLGNADTIIPQIGEKKNTVKNIVDEMQTLQTNHPTASDTNIKGLHTIADNSLTAATVAFNNAKNARAAIQTQKDLADAELTKVKAENQKVSDAQRDANTAEACVRAAGQIVPQLQSALDTATNSETKANDSKQKLQIALSTATSATRTDQSVTQSQVKRLQDSVSASVKTIQTMMKETDSLLLETENHKDAVHEIVQQMKTLKTTAKLASNQDINALFRTAESELTKATNTVEKVKAEKEAMRQQKILADAALSNVATATDVNTAHKEVDIANECVNQVKKFAAKLKGKPQIAKDSVKNAKALKQKLMTVLSTTTTAPSTVQATETAKANPQVGQGTDPDQKDAKIQPTSKELPNQSNNSAKEIKDKLLNGVQNVPTTALTGGKAPAPGANNDSAMTVSVPLLVALIASAVLQ